MKLNTIDKVKVINLEVINSNNAKLNIFEDIDKIFEIKRIFTVAINDFKDDERGRHAHKIDHQIITCPYGSIKSTVKDGINSKTYMIDNQSQIIYVPRHIWTETNYIKKNTVVSCYCSENYNEDSYIRDYKEFLRFRGL